jgi:hypothetical protein
MKRILFVLLVVMCVVGIASAQRASVSIPITHVEKGQTYFIPVTCVNLPNDVTSCEVVINANQALFSITGIETKVGAFEGKLFAFNSSPIVHNWQDNTINTEWISPYNGGQVIAVMATERPLQAAGETLMFVLKGTAVADGDVVLYCSYLLLNTQVHFGAKPLMIHLK